MSLGERSSGPVFAVGGVAGVDVLARALLELLYAGDPVAIAVGGGALLSRYVLDAATLTWALGWVVLGMAVFVVTPHLFPEELLAWARGVPARAVLTVGTVAVAFSLDSTFAALAVFGASPVDAPPLALLAAFAGVLVLVPVTRQLPWWCSGVPLVNCPKGTMLRTGREFRSGEILARILVIVTLAALFLVLLSRLFPIPEIVLVGLAVVEMGQVLYAGGGDPPDGRKDPAERAVLGLGAVWYGPEAVLALLYAVAPVFFVLYFDLRALEMFAGAFTPRTVAFLLATLGAATLSALVASVRLIERLPRAFLADSAGADVRLADRFDDLHPTADAAGVDVRLADRFDDLHPRVPGLMLLPAALLVVFGSQAPIFRELGPRPQYTLSVSTPELGVALALAGVALAITLRTRWFSGLRVIERDYHAAVASGALFVGVPLGYGIAVHASDAPDVSLLVLVPVLVYALVGLMLSPFLGYELFDSDPDASDQLQFSLLVDEIKIAFVLLIAFSIFSAIVLTPIRAVAALFVPEWVVTLLLGPVVAPITTGLLVRVALLPFYLPERLFG